MFVHIMESYFVVIFSYVLAYLMGSSIINISKCGNTFPSKYTLLSSVLIFFKLSMVSETGSGRVKERV